MDRTHYGQSYSASNVSSLNDLNKVLNDIKLKSIVSAISR